MRRRRNFDRLAKAYDVQDMERQRLAHSSRRFGLLIAVFLANAMFGIVDGSGGNIATFRTIQASYRVEIFRR